MIQNKKLKIGILSAILSMSLLPACQNNNIVPETSVSDTENNTEQETEKICYVTIEGDATEKEIAFESGESVYDVLKKTDAVIVTQNTAYGVFVEAINGKFAGDEGSTSGWVYTVNGEDATESCSSHIVEEGDKIEWKYQTEW